MSKTLKMVYVCSSQQKWTGIIFSQPTNFKRVDVGSEEAGHSVQNMS